MVERIRMRTAMFAKLLEPIKIGKMEMKNRIAMAPMGIGGLLNPDGSPGPAYSE
jgi:2,4-dienoyl-CoA reductase-like NADH-dependent reductase (Old Yellow Enzyme family)